MQKRRLPWLSKGTISLSERDTARLCFMIVLIIVVAVIRGRDVKRRDPVRRFSRQHRREGTAPADGQCEMEAGFRRRCSRPAEHGDHFYPVVQARVHQPSELRRGVQQMQPRERRADPSPAQQERLEQRRRTYGTLVGAVSVGERQPLP